MGQVLNGVGRGLAKSLYNPVEERSLEILNEFLPRSAEGLLAVRSVSPTSLAEHTQWEVRKVVDENLPKLPQDKRGKTPERDVIVRGVSSKVKGVTLFFHRQLIDQVATLLRQNDVPYDKSLSEGQMPAVSGKMTARGLGDEDSSTIAFERSLYKAGHPYMSGHSNMRTDDDGLLVLRGRERQANILHKLTSRLPKAIDVSFRQYVRAAIDETLAPHFPAQDVLNEYRGNATHPAQKYAEARKLTYARSLSSELPPTVELQPAEWVEE